MENEDVDRYEKLLKDWRPGRPRGPGPAKPSDRPLRDDMFRPDSGDMYRPGAQGSDAQANPRSAAYNPGSILRLQDRTVVIYKQPVPEKGYHLVYTLIPGGTLKLQGVALEGYQVEEIGSIGQPQFDQLQQAMVWTRDLLVFHCYRYEDVDRIPQRPEVPETGAEPGPAATAASPAPSSPSNGRQSAEAKVEPLRRGQRLQVRFGAKSWDAVYWGQDSQGHVVAHQTFNKWALMHLELDRFGGNVQIDPTVDEEVIGQIEENINNQG